MKLDRLVDRWSRMSRWSFVIGVVGVALTGLGFVLDQDQFWRSYLESYLFWWTLTVGSLGVAMLHNLTGGRWGEAIRPYYLAGGDMLPLVALLFVPLAFGLPKLYPWADASVVAHDPLLQKKAIYLNADFFLIRAAIYFAVWIVLAMIVNRWAARVVPFTRRPGGLQRICAGGLVLLVFTVSFAAFDWAMSLEPHWFSAIYGAEFCIGSLLGAFGVMLASLSGWAGLNDPELTADNVCTDPDVRVELGNLFLAFTMLWAYFNFSQMLIIWSGNLPEETVFYIERMKTGWKVLSIVLPVFHFVAPLMLLLSRDVKQGPRLLPAVAVGLLVMHAVDLEWLIAPSFYESLTIHWLDIATFAGIGGLWLGLYSLRVRSGLAVVPEPHE